MYLQVSLFTSVLQHMCHSSHSTRVAYTARDQERLLRFAMGHTPLPHLSFSRFSFLRLVGTLLRSLDGNVVGHLF